MDAVWERMESVWKLSWLGRGCSVGRDGVCVDVLMAAQLYGGAFARGGRSEFASKRQHHTANTGLSTCPVLRHDVSSEG